jgi:hypothetical protein
MVRPHNAQTVLPFPFVASSAFADRFVPLCWRGIETESHVAIELDSLFFSLTRQDRANSLFTSGLSSGI